MLYLSTSLLCLVYGIIAISFPQLKVKSLFIVYFIELLGFRGSLQNLFFYRIFKLGLYSHLEFTDNSQSFDTQSGERSPSPRLFSAAFIVSPHR